jgi:hypothetical protein
MRPVLRPTPTTPIVPLDDDWSDFSLDKRQSPPSATECMFYSFLSFFCVRCVGREWKAAGYGPDSRFLSNLAFETVGESLTDRY